MGEKRRNIRFNILMDAICGRGESFKKLKINNFSRDGVGIISSETFQQGEDVELEMTIPGDNMPIMLHGEVAWSNNSESDDGKHKTGLRFKNVRNEDRSRILEYIYQKWIVPNKEK